MDKKKIAMVFVMLMVTATFAGVNIGRDSESATTVLPFGSRVTSLFLADGYLQSMIDNASNGDTIYVSNGTHDIIDAVGSEIFFNKSITVCGNGSAVLNLTGIDSYFENVNLMNITIVTDMSLNVNDSCIMNVTNSNISIVGGGGGSGFYLNNSAELNFDYSSLLLALPGIVPPVVPNQGPDAVDLGVAGNFTILSKSGISTTGSTAIVGDIGVSPIAATGITGFDLVLVGQYATSTYVTGKVYASDYDSPTPAYLTEAVSDMEAAYTDAMGRTGPDATELGAGDISGMDLYPGLYKWTTDLMVNGTGVTLHGNASDVFIFQVDGKFNLTGDIYLTGGLQANNIFWAVSEQVTLGTYSSMKGVILTYTAIVMGTGATLGGRALSQTAITLDANAVDASGYIVPIAPGAGVGIYGYSGNFNVITMNHSQIIGFGNSLIELQGSGDVIINNSYFIGTPHELFLYVNDSNSNVVIKNSIVANQVFSTNGSVNNTCWISDSVMCSVYVNQADFTMIDTTISMLFSEVSIDEGDVVLDGDTFNVAEGETGVSIGTNVSSVSISNCVFNMQNNTVGLYSGSPADIYINDTHFNISTNSAAIVLDNDIDLYLNNVSWSLTNLSAQIVVVSGPWNINVYSDDSSDFSAIHVSSGSGSEINLYTDFTVKTEENVTVVLKSSPSVTVASDIADEFGDSSFTNIVYGFVNETGYYNNSYIFEAMLPASWNMSGLLVRDTTRGVNVTHYVSDRNVTWTAYANDYIVVYSANTGGLTFRYENDNASVSGNAIPGTVIVTEHRIIIENKNTYRYYREFIFGLFNFTGNFSNVDTTNFTLVVWKDAQVYKTLTTSNGTVFFSGALAFGEEFWLQFQFSLKNYVISGVYSGRWAFGGKNDTESTKAGTMGLTVKSVPAFNLEGTFGTPSEVRFPSGMQAGTDTDYITINELRVKNTGNIQLDKVHINIGNFVGTDTWDPSPDRIKVQMVTWGGDSLFQEYAVDDSGNVEISFTSTTIGTLMPIGINQWRDFRFKMVSTPYTADGDYTSTLKVKVKPVGSDTYLTPKTIDLNITIGAARVSIGITYNGGDEAPTNPALDQDNLGLQWSAELDPSAPQPVNALSDSYFVVINTGNLAINTLLFVFEDLKHNDHPALYQINIGGNAKLVTSSAEISLNRVLELGTHYGTYLLTFPENAPLAVDGRMDFKVKILRAENGLGGTLAAGSYGGSFSVTATHFPLSRSTDYYNATAYGSMGSISTAENISAYLTDNGDKFTYSSPVSVGDYAEQDLIISNARGDTPINLLRFSISSITPAVYSIFDVANGIEYPVVGSVMIPCEMQVGNIGYYKLRIRAVVPTYDPIENYLQNVIVDAILFTDFNRSVDVATVLRIADIPIAINPVSAMFEARAGLNWFCIGSDNSNFQTASDIIAQVSGVAFVTIWDSGTNSFIAYYYDGRGTNFALSYGQGVIIFCSYAVDIPIVGDSPVPTNYSLESGLQLVGNPTSTPIYVADFLENAENVNFVAKYVNGAFQAYYPSDPVHSTNFLIGGNSAVWVQVAIGRTDIIIY